MNVRSKYVNLSRLMTRRVYINIFQQRCIKTTTFVLKRGLVVHLDVGVHVADVAVDDQVHVTKLFISNFNQRGGSRSRLHSRCV